MEGDLKSLADVLDTSQPVTNWGFRSAHANTAFLRDTFKALVAESQALPPEQRLVMYDACDEHEVVCTLGSCLRKRLDARRNTKPKKPDAQRLVCTPFDPDGFNFSKIKNPRERLLRVCLSSGSYEVLTNKFPLFPGHMLLVARDLVPQQMRLCHLRAVTELLAGCGFSAYFNSWCASASVNHFHCHLIDEMPPVTRWPLVPGPYVLGARCLQPDGFPGFCYVFEASQTELVSEVVSAMQEDNQPHNFLFTGRHIYLFPKPLQRPERSFELYPETVGGPELLGSFTVYQQADYDALSTVSAEELCRLNTAPLPTRVLHRGADGAPAADDSPLGMRTASFDPVTKLRAAGRLPASRSVDGVPTAYRRIVSLPSALAAQKQFVCAN